MKDKLLKYTVWAQIWRDENGQDLVEYGLVIALDQSWRDSWAPRLCNYDQRSVYYARRKDYDCLRRPVTVPVKRPARGYALRGVVMTLPSAVAWANGIFDRRRSRHSACVCAAAGTFSLFLAKGGLSARTEEGAAAPGVLGWERQA